MCENTSITDLLLLVSLQTPAATPTHNGKTISAMYIFPYIREWLRHWLTFPCPNILIKWRPGCHRSVIQSDEMKRTSKFSATKCSRILKIGKKQPWPAVKLSRLAGRAGFISEAKSQRSHWDVYLAISILFWKESHWHMGTFDRRVNDLEHANRCLLTQCILSCKGLHVLLCKAQRYWCMVWYQFWPDPLPTPSVGCWHQSADEKLGNHPDKVTTNLQCSKRRPVEPHVSLGWTSVWNKIVFPFSTYRLLVRQQQGHLARRKLGVGLLALTI